MFVSAGTDAIAREAGRPLTRFWSDLPEQHDQRHLLAVAGIADQPREHTQQPLVLDLTGERVPAAPAASAFSVTERFALAGTP